MGARGGWNPQAVPRIIGADRRDRGADVRPGPGRQRAGGRRSPARQLSTPAATQPPEPPSAATSGTADKVTDPQHAGSERPRRAKSPSGGATIKSESRRRCSRSAAPAIASATKPRAEPSVSETPRPPPSVGLAGSSDPRRSSGCRRATSGKRVPPIVVAREQASSRTMSRRRSQHCRHQQDVHRRRGLERDKVRAVLSGCGEPATGSCRRRRAVCIRRSIAGHSRALSTLSWILLGVPFRRTGNRTRPAPARQLVPRWAAESRQQGRRWNFDLKQVAGNWQIGTVKVQ